MNEVGRSCLAAGIVLCTMLVACGGGVPVRLAVILPLSGAGARCGIAVREGVELAHQESLDVAEADVELLFGDSQGDPQRGASLLTALFEQGAVAALGGLGPEEAAALAAVAGAEGRVVLSPSPVSLAAPAGGARQFFRLSPSPLQEASAVVSFVRETLGLGTLVVAGAASPSEAAHLSLVGRAAAAGRVTIVEGPVLDAEASRAEILLETLRRSDAEAVLLVADARTVDAVASSLRRAGFGGPILATSRYVLAGDSTHETAPESGVLFPLPAFDPAARTASVERFVTAFRGRSGRTPDLCAANGYDGLTLLVAALRRGGSSPSGVWKGLRTVRDFPGIRRTLQFDERGEVLDFPHMHRFEAGVLVDHEGWLEERRQELADRIRELEQRRLLLLGEIGGG